ncbi:MAG: DUF5134 domain-containing protein [Actinomycetota bacterium]|nr:DUF5134 domain-containing protein [Actinomycetota bacterium]
MFNIPAITWTITAVLVLTGGHHLLLVTHSRPLVERVNNSLHALMNAVMAAMLWNLAPATMLAQIAALAAAALWFAIQAAARPEFKTLCAGSRSRLKCLYHSLTMATTALMVAAMGHMTATGPGIVPAAGTSHAHHMTAAAVQTTAAGAPDVAGLLTVLPTIFFGAAVIVFTVLLILSRATKATVRHAVAPRMPVRAVLGLEALGAAVMALMFASLSA